MARTPETGIRSAPMQEQFSAMADGTLFVTKSPGLVRRSIATVTTTLTDVGHAARSLVEIPLAVGLGIAAVTQLQLHTRRHHSMPADLGWDEYSALSAKDRKAYEADRAAAYTDLAKLHNDAEDPDAAAQATRTAEFFRE